MALNGEITVLNWGWRMKKYLLAVAGCLCLFLLPACDREDKSAQKEDDASAKKEQSADSKKDSKEESKEEAKEEAAETSSPDYTTRHVMACPKCGAPMKPYRINAKESFYRCSGLPPKYPYHEEEKWSHKIETKESEAER